MSETGAAACLHLTHERVAAMTGSVREVVQRALKTLEREGAIELGRGRIRIVEPAILAVWSAAGKPDAG